MVESLIEKENMMHAHFSLKTHYSIAHDGEEIGRHTSLRNVFGAGSDKIINISDDLEIKIEDVYALSSKEMMVLTEQGLMQYEGHFFEDDEQLTINARFLNNALLIEGKENGEAFDLAIDKNSYDASSEEVGGYFVKNGEKEKILQVLDLDDFEIRSILYSYEGMHDIELAGHCFKSHMIAFKSEKKTGKQWLVEDCSGIWLLKESGTDSEGDYSIKLSGYECTEPDAIAGECL